MSGGDRKIDESVADVHKGKAGAH